MFNIYFQICPKCFSNSVRARASNHFRMNCPSCGLDVTDKEYASVLARCTPEDRLVIERVYLRSAIHTMKDVIHCSRVNCECVYAVAAPEAGRACSSRLVQCPSCAYPSCAECKSDYHGEISCAAYTQTLLAQMSVGNGGVSAVARQAHIEAGHIRAWRTKHTKKCPGCGMRIHMHIQIKSRGKSCSLRE